MAWGGAYSGDGGPATAASLYLSLGIAIDASGNVYIGDEGNFRIRKVNTSGIISTFAGNGSSGYSGDGSPATAAAIGQPLSLTFDGSGNLYFTDNVNNLVRKISASGIISTVAGNGIAGYIDGCPATAAELNGPTGIALDGAGNIYVGDGFNNRIRKINTSGIISTYAGNGAPGFAGDGSPATAAMLYNPYGMATDGSGNVYIVDVGNHRIRKICYPPALAAITGTASAICLTATLSLSASLTGGTWGVVTGNASVSGTGTAAIATGVAGGVDTIIYTLTNSCYFTSAKYPVTVNPAPYTSAITGTPSVCLGITDTLTDSVAGGTWFAGTSGVAIMGSAGASSTAVTGIAAGTGVITYSVTNSCGTAAVVFPITVNPLPVTGTITGVHSVCPGGMDTLTDTAAGGAWSSATTAIAAISGSAGLTVAVTGIASGIDTVYYRVTNSCGTAVVSAVVTVNPLPVIDPIIGPDTVCISHDPIIPIALTDSTFGGAWAASNVKASVASGLVIGMSAGIDNIFYSISNICGTDTAFHAVVVKRCTEEVTNINPTTTTLTIFPNPNDGTFALSITSPTNEQASITITNILGEKVKEFTTTTNTPTQVKMEMPEGVYFLSAITKEGIFNAKFIVNQQR